MIMTFKILIESRHADLVKHVSYACSLFVKILMIVQNLQRAVLEFSISETFVDGAHLFEQHVT